MTQVSHVQEDCQRPPTDADDYFRWQIESAVDYSVGRCAHHVHVSHVSVHTHTHTHTHKACA